jgi:hypothetical protein
VTLAVADADVEAGVVPFTIRNNQVLSQIAADGRMAGAAAALTLSLLRRVAC